jgi:hypothetical protein
MWLELPILLAARLRQIAGIVVGANNDLLHRGVKPDDARDVDTEWRVTALVLAHLGAVYPDNGVVIDSLKVHHKSLLVFKARALECSAIPNSGVEAGFGYPTSFRLGAERNRDLPIPLNVFWNRMYPGQLDVKIPLSIQRRP